MEEEHPKENPISPLKEAYELLGASNPLEMSRLYSEQDQAIARASHWDYDDGDLMTNQVKVALEKVDPTTLSEDEAAWRNEVLWFWYHHAISAAVMKRDKAKAREHADKALSLQDEGHPNRITRLLYYLVNDRIGEAEDWARSISEEPEKTTATELVSEYKEHGYFK